MGGGGGEKLASASWRGGEVAILREEKDFSSKSKRAQQIRYSFCLFHDIHMQLLTDKSNEIIFFF